MKKNILYIAMAAALGFTACQPEIESPISKGSEIDLTKYVAVGNSLTAGYMDGGVYNEGIEASYPNLIAKQFKLVGGGDFVQAYFPEGQENGSGYFKVTGFDSNGVPIVETETNNLAVTGQTLPGGAAQLTAYSGPLPNNLGIPGIAVANLQDPLYSQGNPYFERLKSGNPTSYIDMVGEAAPTFFTCWMGNNDVLGFVTSGGTSPITDAATFQTNYQALIDKLTENGAKGVIANIPNVTSIPYVYAPNALVAQQAGGSFPVIPLDATTAAQLNGAYQLAGYSDPGFQAGNNYPVIVVDDPATASVIEVRQMDPNQDLLLYHFLNPANPTGHAGEIATGRGWMTDTNSDNIPDTPTPIADRDVLDYAELVEAITAVVTFNTIIQQVADAAGIPVIDTDPYLLQVLSGQGIEGVQVDGTPFSGGFFSIDQVHPTPKGYAIMANIFLRHINKAYNANIPLIDINALNPRGVKFP
ncbi:SGNH/GDSL hydrolase family protein [Thermonema rossianum]|uniref:SGNH/GDSL hydrolase family protein n=1 Tax=Thermonema rossianum TaxID=55505 RepID=UPI00146F9D4C|nr:SGNH/GDSL hydrolase family protein [Thermonema rossianum]